MTVTTTRGMTRSMNIFHAALRRDLDRAATVLEDVASTTDDRVRVLGDHLGWLLELLHDHHVGEDERLYPALVERHPGAAGLVAEMAHEHRQVVEAIDRAAAAGRQASGGAAPVAERARALREALTALRGVLDPHLEREELEMMPVVDEFLPQADWDRYEQGNVDRPTRHLAFLGHWIIDGLGPDDTEIVTAAVPPVPRFVLLHLLGGAYRKRRTALWAGTPAAAIRSQPRPTEP